MQPVCPVASPSPISELIACLSALQSNADTVFKRISERCQENRAKIDTFSARITVAKQRLAQVRSENNRRATVVHSPAKFPEVPVQLNNAIEYSFSVATQMSAGRSIPIRGAEPVKSVSLPEAAEMQMWSTQQVKALCVAQPTHSHVLGDGTSIASLIRPQLRAAKPVTSTAKPTLPGGLSDHQSREGLSGWVDPFIPRRNVAPLSLPNDLPGLNAFAADVRFTEAIPLPWDNDIALPRVELPVIPSESLPVQRPIEPARPSRRDDEEWEEVARDQEAREAEARRRSQYGRDVRQREAEARARAQQEERDRQARERQQIEAEKERLAQQQREEEEERKRRETESRQRQASVAVTPTPTAAGSSRRASSAADAPLPKTQDKPGEEFGDNGVEQVVEEDVYSRGAGSAFARELQQRANRPRGDINAIVEAERRERKKNNAAPLAALLLSAFEKKYENARGSDGEGAGSA